MTGRVFSCHFSVVSLLASAAISFCSAAGYSSPSPGTGGRALWVVRTSLLSRESINRLVEKASRGGFNTLFVQVCGRADAYFPSRVFPPAKDCRALLESGFDPLAYVLEKARAKHIAVHAWVNTFLVWSSSGRHESQRHVLNRHPEWMMVDRNGISLSSYGQSRIKKLNMTGIFLSPANKEACRLLEEFILDLAERYPLDGIHLDYLRYPIETVDFSPAAREEFKARSGIDPLDLFSGSDGVNGKIQQAEYQEILRKWTAFRAELITRFLADLTGKLNGRKPRLIRTAAVKPDLDSAYKIYGQDWVRWVKDGLLDIILPMAYSTNPEVVYEQIATACREVGPDHVWAGLRAYNVPVSGIIERTQRIRPLNPAGYCFFSYDGTKDNPLFFERMRYLFPDRRP